MCLLWCRHAGILACCDLQPAGPANTNWTKSMPKGKVCDEEDGHGAHTPSTKLANGTMAGHDHTGHDHAGHDNAANATTKPGTAATAKSAAGAVSAGVLGAAAAAALVLLAL